MSTRFISTFLLSALLATTVAIAGDHTKVFKLGADDHAKAYAIAAHDYQVASAKHEKKEETGAFLGIVPEEVTSDIAADYGVQAGQGVLVESTVDGSPADEAGLRSSDILLAINGQKLTGPSELRVQLDKFKDGDEVSLTFKRGGNERTASAKLVGRDEEHSWSWSWSSDDDAESPMPPMPPHAPKALRWEHMMESSKVAFAGIVTQELSDGLKSYFKVEGGALVSEVVEKSPAEKAGLKAGDIIVKIGTDDVDDSDDVTDAIRDADPDETIDFHLIREGKSMVIPVTLTNRREFYGDAGDPESEFSYGYGPGDAEQLSVEMDQLQEELKDMGVELERIPEVNMDLRIPADGPKIFIGDGDARAISRDEGWWNWTYQDLRTKVKLGIEAIKKDIESLKGEMKQLRTEIKDRMSTLWGPVIDLTPKA